VIATEGMRLVKASVSTLFTGGSVDELFKRMTVSAGHRNAPYEGAESGGILFLCTDQD
jgi:hypothetical protein